MDFSQGFLIYIMATIQEMIATVQVYIHHRKNVEVQISIKTQRDLVLLTRAYTIALNWLNNNGFKQF